MTNSITLPENIYFVEDLAKFCQGPGKGKCIDLGGRHMRPKGGYGKEYGFVWHEHPRPHWYLPFLSDNMQLRNGEITLSPRIMLINRGKSMAIDNVRLNGMGRPNEDERNAFLVIGAESDMHITNVTAEAVGFYFWEGALAQLEDCCFNEGLHGLYVWGKSHIVAKRCKATNMQGSGVCVTEGATVELEDCTCTNSQSGSGVWCGERCKVTLTGCTLTSNAQYGAESNHKDSVLTIASCKIADNAAGDKDTWDGGMVKEA